MDNTQINFQITILENITKGLKKEVLTEEQKLKIKAICLQLSEQS